jgi:hypothetical protein
MDESTKGLIIDSLLGNSDNLVIASLKLIAKCINDAPNWASRLFFSDPSHLVMARAFQLLDEGRYNVKRPAALLIVHIIEGIDAIWMNILRNCGTFCPRLIYAIGRILMLSDVDDCFLGLCALNRIVKWWLNEMNPLLLLGFLGEGGVLQAMEELRLCEAEGVGEFTEGLFGELGKALENC